MATRGINKYTCILILVVIAIISTCSQKCEAARQLLQVGDLFNGVQPSVGDVVNSGIATATGVAVFQDLGRSQPLQESDLFKTVEPSLGDVVNSGIATANGIVVTGLEVIQQP